MRSIFNSFSNKIIFEIYIFLKICDYYYVEIFDKEYLSYLMTKLLFQYYFLSGM